MAAMPALEVASAARAALSRGKPIDCSSCTIWRCAWMSTASCRGEYAESLGPCTAAVPCAMSGLLSIRLCKACKGEQCSPPPSCFALPPQCGHMGTGPMMCLEKVREGPAAEQGTVWAAWPHLCSRSMTWRLAGSGAEWLGSRRQHLAGGRAFGAALLLAPPGGERKRLLHLIVQGLQVPRLQLHLRACINGQRRPHSRMAAGLSRPTAGASTACVPFQSSDASHTHISCPCPGYNCAKLQEAVR